MIKQHQHHEDVTYEFCSFAVLVHGG
jgi:hypothetical protein